MSFLSHPILSCEEARAFEAAYFGGDEARDAGADAEGVGFVEGGERQVDLLPQATRDAGHGG